MSPDWSQVPHRIGLGEHLAMTLAQPGVVLVLLVVVVFAAVVLIDARLPDPPR